MTQREYSMFGMTRKEIETAIGRKVTDDEIAYLKRKLPVTIETIAGEAIRDAIRVWLSQGVA